MMRGDRLYHATVGLVFLVVAFIFFILGFMIGDTYEVTRDTISTEYAYHTSKLRIEGRNDGAWGSRSDKEIELHATTRIGMYNMIEWYLGSLGLRPVDAILKERNIYLPVDIHISSTELVIRGNTESEMLASIQAYLDIVY